MSLQQPCLDCQVFKFKPRGELAQIAAQLHWYMVSAISQVCGMQGRGNSRAAAVWA